MGRGDLLLWFWRVICQQQKYQTAQDHLFPGIQVTLDAMPDNGVILVFTDAGSVGLELENSIAEKARRKNVKIFFALVAGKDLTTGKLLPPVPQQSMKVYSRLSENRIFRASSNNGQLDLDTKAFFDAVTRQVIK